VKISPLKDIMLYFIKLKFPAYQMELPEKNAWLFHGLGDSHQPITSEGKFDDRETHVRFVMDKLIPGQVSL
jgi:hypothetical protein